MMDSLSCSAGQREPFFIFPFFRVEDNKKGSVAVASSFWTSVANYDDTLGLFCPARDVDLGALAIYARIAW